MRYGSSGATVTTPGSIPTIICASCVPARSANPGPGCDILAGMKRLLLFLAAAVLAIAADITGTWNFNVETDMGSGTPTMTFKQEGNVLTGTYKGQLGEAPLRGT